MYKLEQRDHYQQASFIISAKDTWLAINIRISPFMKFHKIRRTQTILSVKNRRGFEHTINSVNI